MIVGVLKKRNEGHTLMAFVHLTIAAYGISEGRPLYSHYRGRLADRCRGSRNGAQKSAEVVSRIIRTSRAKAIAGKCFRVNGTKVARVPDSTEAGTLRA